MAGKIKTDETLPDVPASVAKEARMDGIKEAIADGAKARFQSTDGVETGDVQDGITPTYDVFHLQHLVDMEPDALKDALDGEGANSFALSEGQIAGLLEVERSGKNRTDIVDVLCKRLGIKTPYEVTDAGPAYTNDVSRSVVKSRG